MILIAKDRDKTKQNPLGLDIGDQIVVSATCEVKYVNRKDKVIVKYPGQKTLIIIGIVKKATGTYDKGFTSYFDFGENSEPASLTVNKYHWFYQATLGFQKTIYLVQAEDIINHHLRNN